MNYDTMSAHELVLELQESMRQAVIKWKPVNLNQRAELESALRKAVIREASVGVCSFGKQSDGKWGLTSDDELADGFYDLISHKESHA